MNACMASALEGKLTRATLTGFGNVCLQERLSTKKHHITYKNPFLDSLFFNKKQSKMLQM